MRVSTEKAEMDFLVSQGLKVGTNLRNHSVALFP